MSLYHFLFIFLLLCVGIEYFVGKTPKRLFIFEYAVLTLFLCLRYGQGSDYMGYKRNYNLIPIISSISIKNLTVLQNSSVHGEIGWLLLCSFSKSIGIKFEALIVIISIAMMFLFYKFINKYCENKCLAVLISFHTVYLTYYFSAIREGLVIAVFCSYILQFYLDKKNSQMIFAILLCSMIHGAALCYLILILLNISSIQRYFKSNQIILVIIAWLLGIIGSTGIFNELIQAIIPGSVFAYLHQISFSIGIVERIVMYILCCYCVKCYKVKASEDDIERMDRFLQIDSIGMILYGLNIYSSLVSSRLNILFKVIEIAIISTCIKKLTVSKKIVYIISLSVCLLLYVKSINSFIEQNNYYNTVNFWNFPYISLFNKGDTLKYFHSIYQVRG